METGNFAPLDLEQEYYSTLQASRIAGTALLLLSAAWSAMQCVGIPEAAEIFENMVTGGKAALPRLTELVIDHSTEALALSCLPAFCAALYIWAAGNRLSRVILASVAGMMLSLLVGFAVQYALGRPLIQVITSFHG